MRAIIIEEERFAEIAELMQGKALEMVERSTTAERMGWDQQMWAAAVDEAHRQIHFRFVRWAQSHGASCVPK